MTPDSAGARRLALQAGQLRVAALAAHLDAAGKIEHEHNAGRSLGMDVLDLHGLHASEAVQAVDRRCGPPVAFHLSGMQEVRSVLP